MLSDSALFVHPISENKKQRDFIFTPVQPTQTSSHLDSIFPSPFPGRGLIPDTVGLVNMGDLRDERIVGVGVGQHRANRQKNCGGTISNVSRTWRSFDGGYRAQTFRDGKSW